MDTDQNTPPPPPPPPAAAAELNTDFTEKDN